MVQKTLRKNVTSTVLIFPSFSLFDGRHGWKNHNQLKRTAKIETEETHAHRLVTSQMMEGNFIISQKPIILTHPHPVQNTFHLPGCSGAEKSLQHTHFTHFNNLPLPLLGARLIECHAKAVKIPAVYSKESGFKSCS